MITSGHVPHNHDPACEDSMPQRKKPRRGQPPARGTEVAWLSFPDIWSTVFAFLDPKSLSLVRACCAEFARKAGDDSIWQKHIQERAACELPRVKFHDETCLHAFIRLGRVLRLRRRGNRDLVSVWTPATPESGRDSDARKLTQKITDDLPKLTFFTTTELRDYLFETFPDQVISRIAVRNYLRSCGHPYAYAPDPQGREVVIMVGLPSSGKSTYIKKHLASHKVVRSVDSVEGLLEEGMSVVLDHRNSHPMKHRGPIIRAAEHLGVPVRMVHIATKWSVCKERNAKRPVEEQANQFAFSAFQQYFEPPSILEGCHEVITV